MFICSISLGCYMSCNMPKPGYFCPLTFAVNPLLSNFIGHKLLSSNFIAHEKVILRIIFFENETDLIKLF